MSINKILKNIASVLPLKVQREIYWRKNRLTRSSVIADWKSKGMPVPPPHQYKQSVVEEVGKKYNLSTLIETGTLYGLMIECQRKFFKKLVSVELDQKLFEDAKNYFKDYDHIKIFQGDSSDLMPKMLDEIVDDSVLFWLDGHYSGGNTALGKKECPIYEELKSIFGHAILHKYILIDDARSFTGTHDYPTISELEDYVNMNAPDLNVTIKNDIIHIFKA